MFKVGEIVKYAPQYCGEGEQYYIHEVKEANDGRYLISTLNTMLTLGSTQRVTEDMIQKASKYEVITWHGKYIVTDTESKKFFAGYDFMGSVEWVDNQDEAEANELEYAEQYKADLESADEPAEPKKEEKKMTTISKEELRAEFAKAWESDRMINYCTNKVAATAVLPTGEIITIDKESIKKDFCFGESGYDFDEAQEAAAMARKSHEYFKIQNMKHFKCWIDDITNAMDLHSNYRIIIGGGAYYGQSEDCRLRHFEICLLTQVLDALGGSAFLEEIPGKEITVDGRTGRVATNEEAEIILNAYKEAAAKHEKKVDAYLKKYGTSKVNSWTYWRDA